MNPSERSELFKPYQSYQSLPSTSAAYYCLLFLPESQRAPLRALFFLDQTLRQALRRVSDISLAVGKHVFWQEELRTLTLSNTSLRHPLSNYLDTFDSFKKQSLACFLEREAMLMEQTRFLDEANLGDYLSLQSRCWQLWQNVYTDLIGAPQVNIDALAQTLERIRIVCQLGKDSQEGRIFIPVNTLQRFDIRAAYLINHQPNQNINTWLIQEADQIEASIHGQLQIMSANDRYHSRPFLIFLQIARQRLKQSVKIGAEIVRQPVVLSPVQKLYPTWKTWVFSRWIS
jgi:phytoene synthase